MGELGRRLVCVLAATTLVFGACDTTPPSAPGTNTATGLPAGTTTASATPTRPQTSVGLATTPVSASPSPTLAATSGGGTATPAGVDSGELRVGIHDYFGAWDNAATDPDVVQWLYDGLYRTDDHLQPQPNLAAAPCDVSTDLLVITCRLVSTTFHDGAPLTADDVVYTYELRRRPTCVDEGMAPCLGDRLKSAVAPDSLTVQFTLVAPDPRFLTEDLPGVFIEERRVIEASFSSWEAAAKQIGAGRLQALGDAGEADVHASPPDCHTRLAETVAATETLGISWNPNEFRGQDGQIDPCWQLDSAASALQTSAAALGSTGLDRVAAVYPVLSIDRHPVGTGPWSFVSYDPGHEVVLKAFAGYHFGPPATSTIWLDAEVTRGPELQVAQADHLDWVPFVHQDQAVAAEQDPSFRVLVYPTFSYLSLMYNVRPGRLFSDVRLRQALAMCIDKPRIVQAAEGTFGTVLWSNVLPASWAYEPSVPQTVRDVPAARALIESAGWAMGSDGVYQKDGQRLSADILVRGDQADRVHFVDLLDAQVSDCGMDLHVGPADIGQLVDMTEAWPPIDPTTAKPFELYFGGFFVAPDPEDTIRQFASWLQTSASHQGDGFTWPNFTGFSDPEVDRLIRAGEASYDQRERARVYKQLQLVIARDQPYLFAYAQNFPELISARLTSRSGPLDFDSPYWAWRLEDLFLAP